MNHLKILDSVLSVLHETGSASKGSMGKLMGDKAELVICQMTKGVLAPSNQPGYDLIGKAFLASLKQEGELRYEVKLRRNSVTACNFERSKIGKFDIGIVIRYDADTLLPSTAYAIPHVIIENICNDNRAHITLKVCREYGIDFIEQLREAW